MKNRAVKGARRARAAMIGTLRWFRDLVRDRRGANMVEYVVLVGVVALFALPTMKSFGDQVSQKVIAQAAKISSI